MKNKLKKFLANVYALFLIGLTAGLGMCKLARAKVGSLNWHIDVTTLKSNVINFNNPSGNGSNEPHYTVSKRLNLKAIVVNLAIAGPFGTGIGVLMGTGFGIGALACIALLGTGLQLFMPWYKNSNLSARLIMAFGIVGMTYAGIAQEVWIDVITPHLYPENSWVYESMDDSAYLDGLTVHLPQIGNAPNVVRNRTGLPATGVQRTDTINSYNIDEYTTDPTIITYTEEDIVSYDKLASVVQDHIDVLKTNSLDAIMNSWCPAAPTAGQNLRLTSGTDRPAGTTTQTGNRKAAVMADITAMQLMFNQQIIPQEDRVCALDPVLFNDLLQIEQFTNMFYIGATVGARKGIIEEAIGFKIYVNPLAPTYSSANALNALGAVPQAADNLCGVFWHPRFVRRAWGNLANGGIKVFENPERAEYYGGIYSAMVRAGGSPARSDRRGIGVLVETT